jgi:hypothetical protein
VDQFIRQLLRTRIHAERVEFQAPGLLVQQTQHHALAVARGNRRHAHIDRTARDA